MPFTDKKRIMENKYTFETLLEINQSYDSEHRLRQSDVDMANRYVRLIEGTRSDKEPRAGDRIRFTTKHGDYHNLGHIEEILEVRIVSCLEPYIPFIRAVGDTGIRCNTSGGPWQGAPVNEVKYVGKEQKTFKDWGYVGPRGNGAVYFDAEVNVWEYVEPGALYGDYTTQFWRKYYLHEATDKLEKETGYRFTGNEKAFKTREDLDDFLRWYKGEIFQGNWLTQRVLWCYREEITQVDQSVFDSLELPIMPIYCNGQRDGKVSYDDKNKIINIHIAKLNPNY